MPGSLKRRAKKSRAPRRRLNPDARRSELLDAALCVLGKRNPTEVCVEDVTRAAGAAKGTFYRYFPSWEDLLLALREHLLSTYASDFRARFAGLSPSNWWAELESECVWFVDFVVGLGSLHYTIFHGPIADHPIDAEHSATTLITEMLKAGIAAGVVTGMGSVPLRAARGTATDWVTLGKSGVKVTRLAFGTGTISGKVQRDLGQEEFTKLVEAAI